MNFDRKYRKDVFYIYKAYLSDEPFVYLCGKGYRDRDDEILREGYFSIKDSMADVKANPEANAIFLKIIAPLQEKIFAAYGDVAKATKIPPEIQAMMDRMSVEATLKQMGKLVTPDIVHTLNGALNEVKK